MYATKVVTSGEGGAVSTDDDELADRLRLARNHGMVHGYDSRHLGLNYRLPELNAAIASVQMDKLQRFLRARRKNAAYLNERFKDVAGAEFTQDGEDRAHVFYLYTLFLKKNRDKILKTLNDSGIGGAVYFRIPVHKTPLYARLGYGRKTLKETESASAHVLSLPVHPGLSQEDLELVGDKFVQFAHSYL